LGFIIPFQGTPIYKHCVKVGIIPDEIQFIEDRAKYGYDLHEPMDLTEALTLPEFERLKDNVFTTAYVSRTFVIPRKDRWGIRSGITIDCPYCMASFYVMNRDSPRMLHQEEISCRHCHSRFVLVSNQGYRVFIFLVGLFGFPYLYQLKQKLIKVLS
jgi:hypothetical protein